MEKTACPSSYVVVDLETTGLYPSQDRILEIGAVKVLDGEVADTFCMFADPQMKPTPAEAVRAFLDFCGELDLMGHNLIFDYSFLKHQAADQKISFEKNGIDTLKIARTLLPDLESRSLTNLCGYFQIDRAHAHRAYHDALATHELYQHLIRIAGEGQERIFQPKQLQYKVKRRGPITPAQKAYLNDLVKYHKIELDVSVDSLTKNEASRKIDTIIARYGRIKR